MVVTTHTDFELSTGKTPGGVNWHFKHNVFGLRISVLGVL